MKYKKEMLDSIDAGTDYELIICCALYLNTKVKSNYERKIGATIHEQVAALKLQGNDEKRIARKTGFGIDTVSYALKDIIAFCGARG